MLSQKVKLLSKARKKKKSKKRMYARKANMPGCQGGKMRRLNYRTGCTSVLRFIYVLAAIVALAPLIQAAVSTESEFYSLPA